MNKNITKNIKLVFDILRDEVRGDLRSARDKMDKDFTVTYMYKNSKGEMFPCSSRPSDSELTEVYEIKGRSYEIKNYAENHFNGYDVVFVEFIERYTDPKTGQKYQTPVVVVLEIKDGKIKTNRHYCDNDVSFENISTETLKSAFKGENESIVIDK